MTSLEFKGRFRLLLLAVWWLVFPAGVEWSSAANLEAASGSPLVVVESAEYRGLVQGDEIVNGDFVLSVARHGDAPAALDLTGIRHAVRDLKWESQPAVAGTAADGRLLVLTDRDADRLSGKWSAHGETFGPKTVFDLIVPTALDTRITLDVPSEFNLEASQGFVEVAPSTQTARTRRWTVELGSGSATTLKLSPVPADGNPHPVRYEIDTEHRARRDGIFVRSDLILDWPHAGGQPLQLEIPAALEIQTITLLSGTSQPGPALAYVRDRNQPDLVNLTVDTQVLDSRFTVRVRAFLRVNWGENWMLPRVRLKGALESRRTVSIRVEPPLQLQAVEANGLIQTGLTSDDTTGEVWRFEAREPDAQLSVEIDFPRSPIVADVISLTDLRPTAGWVAAVINMHVENGSRFESTIQLPEEWRLVSVSAGDVESRLASWELNRHVLVVAWQNAMTRTSSRQLRLFARCPTWKEQVTTRLPVPVIRLARDVSYHQQFLVPPDLEMQVIEGEGWRMSEGTELSTELRPLREVSERVGDPAALSFVSLRSIGESHGGRVVVNLAPRRSTLELGLLPRKNEGAIEVPVPVLKGEPEAEPQTSEPAAALRLLTMAGQSSHRDCVHHAVLQFDRPVPVDDLKLRLPIQCRVSAVLLDDRAVTIFREGDAIPFPAEISQVTTLRLTYVTSAPRSFLHQVVDVPLPLTRIPVRRFQWTLDLPRERLLARAELPGILQGTPTADARRSETFGPLTRQPGERIFNPLRSEDWSSLLARGAEQPAPRARQSRNFFAPTVGDHVRFVTWDLQRARSYGWVALLGCLMIGAAARLFRILWLRQLTLVWLSLLMVAIVIAPAAWTMILGGMLTGSLLSVLVPRQWMQQQDFLARSSRTAPPPRELAAIAVLLLLSNISWGQTTDAASPEPSVGHLAAQDFPLYLLASAKYEVTRISPNPAVHATFKVYSQRQPADVFVLLPLQNIVFAADAECLVNGKKQAVIPAVSGDGLVINLGHGDPPKEGEKPKLEWIESLIELDFVMRPAPMGTEVSTNLFRAVIPSILDSRLIASEDLGPISIEHWGSSRTVSGKRMIELGGLGKLWSESPNQSPPVTAGTTAVSQLEFSPLRIQGQTRIMPGLRGWEGELPLSFPKGCLISSLTGPSVIDWIQLPESEDLSHCVVRLRRDIPAAPLVVAFELPAESVRGPNAHIPAIPLWGSSAVPHAVGLSSPPATTFSLVSTTGVTELTPEEWQSLSEDNRSRPPVTVFLKTPQQISLQWSKLSSQRRMSIAETFLVRRESLEWTATLKTSIAQVPAFRHQLLLDPAMRISSIVAGERGSEGSIRFSREGNQLTLFLPGGQLGERTFVITGHMPFSVDTWSSLPELDAAATVVTDRQLSILDETYWNVELETSEGDRIPVNIAQGAPVQTNMGARSVAEFGNGQTWPSKLRTVLPIDATKAECITMLKTPSEGDWELISTFHLDALESSLRKAVFFVPHDYSGIRVRPSLFQHTQVPFENGTKVTVKIPDRYSSAATVTLAARISPEMREQLLEERKADRSAPVVPPIEVQSARKVSQLILLDRNSPLQLAPGGTPRISAEAFPLWAPAEWMRGVRGNELICSQQIRRELSVQRKSAAESGSEPVIQLEETAAWLLENGEQRGITRLWMATRQADQLRITHGEDIHIEEAVCDVAGPLKLLPGSRGTDLLLPKEEGLTSLAIHWSRTAGNSGIQLLDFGTQQPVRRLAAIVHPEGTRLTSAGGAETDRLEIWLLRWEALLNCLDHVSTSLSVDGVLLQNVRLCQKECESLVQQSGDLPSSQRQLFERLSAEWKDRKSDLIVSSTPPTSPMMVFENSFVDLLQNDASSLPVTWLSPRSRNWNAEIHGTVIRGRLWKGAAGLAMLFLVVCVVRLFSKPIHRLRDALSGYPAWSVLMLGVVWWILLEPSALGLFIIVVSIGWICGQWLYRFFPESTSERSKPA